MTVHPTAELVGESPATERLRRELAEVAPFELPVLLLGETGTGKSLAARVLHEASRRRRRALVTVACPALPDTLFERELFGTERGAYTGAERAADGLAVRADGGTLFLEEVGDLCAANQAKLLHFLDGQRVRRVGGLEEREVDVRVVAATNRDPGRAGFRQDLRHRLGAWVIRVPSLAERLDDVPVLARRFAADLALRARLPPPTLTAGAAAWLLTRPWPGNVRELQNVVRAGVVRATAAGTTQLDPAHLAGQPVEIPSRWRAGTDAFQRVLLRQALDATGGNRAAAARRLGLARSALYEQLSRLGLGP